MLRWCPKSWHVVESASRRGGNGNARTLETGMDFEQAVRTNLTRVENNDPQLTEHSSRSDRRGFPPSGK